MTRCVVLTVYVLLLKSSVLIDEVLVILSLLRSVETVECDEDE